MSNKTSSLAPLTCNSTPAEIDRYCKMQVLSHALPVGHDIDLTEELTPFEGCSIRKPCPDSDNS